MRSMIAIAPYLKWPGGGAQRHVNAGATLFQPPHINRADYIKEIRRNGNVAGILIASAIYISWASLLYIALFQTNTGEASLLRSTSLALGLTWIYTGMFITAHDAMHGLICPSYRRLNNFIGLVCVKTYAMFDYKMMTHLHWAHHRHSGQVGDDPDLHDGVNKGPVRWFIHFMIGYVTATQMALMTAVTMVLLLVFQVPVPNVLIFWCAPKLLSSAQLFYFGTYLPHREQDFVDKHRAATDYSKSNLYQFVTCFNFGLHHEHHLYPWCPWWRLQAMKGFDLAAKVD